MGAVWAKLIELIDIADWQKVELLNNEVKQELVNDCTIQLVLFDDYALAVSNRETQESKEYLTLLIANRILLELKSIPGIKDFSVRKEYIKRVFEELIAIQYPLKALDFDQYKSIFSLIRSMYHSSEERDVIIRKLHANKYYQTISESCS